MRAADRELARLSRRDALAAGLADALSILVVGATVAGVLAVAVAAHETAALDRCSSRPSPSWHSPHSTPSPRCRSPRGSSSALWRRARVLDLTDRQAAIRDPAVPAPAPSRSDVVTLEG